MKTVRFFFSENFHFLVVNFSLYLNRHVFVMQALHHALPLHIHEASAIVLSKNEPFSKLVEMNIGLR